MSIDRRKVKFYYLAFLKHDFKASITVFFVALPLCLGISLASNAPVYSGLVAGIIGGIVISLISKSALSVSGPAAGLTAISAAAILQLGNLELFFLAVSISGILQVILGLFKLGAFTHFVPSAVIKGMLSAIGIILISKQIPIIIGYDKPDFWTNELFNIVTFKHGFKFVYDLYEHSSAGVIFISLASFTGLWIWKKTMSKKVSFIPSSIIAIVIGTTLALIFEQVVPLLSLKPTQFVNIPNQLFAEQKFPAFDFYLTNVNVWKSAIVICLVASLETLLSIEAVDKLDPYNRISPPNKELIAQGTGNILSGLFGGIPITAVIVRSAANAEAGGRTRLSAFCHGIWLFLVIVFCVPIINHIPYCVLAVILIRTGFNLVKPKMIKAVYLQGREQFMPFIVTLIAILFTDLLIGVLIGIVYALYFLVKHTYRAGFVFEESIQGHTKMYTMELALNVSFLNKKRVMKLLDEIPEFSTIEIIGTQSVYIDHDILEIIQQFKSKAHQKHIQLKLTDIPDVETIGLH